LKDGHLSSSEDYAGVKVKVGFSFRLAHVTASANQYSPLRDPFADIGYEAETKALRKKLKTVLFAKVSECC